MGIFSFNRGGARDDLGPPPPPFRVPGQSGSPRFGPTERWLLIAGLALIFFIVANVLRDLYTEWLWFGSVGYESAYLVILRAKVGLFVIGLLVFLIFLLVNFFIAKWLSPPLGDVFASDEDIRFARGLVNLGIAAGGLFIGVIFGSVAAGRWQDILKFFNAETFGATDPIFNQDIGFYVFTLPFYRFLQGWILGAVLVTLVAAVIVYAFNFSLQRFNLTVPRGIKVHLALLGAIVFLLFSWGYWMDAFDILRSPAGIVYGAGYTDLNARLLVFRILMVISGATAFFVMITAFMRGVLLPVVALAAWAFVMLVGGSFYPGVIQRFQVEPNELTKEAPFIAHNIRMTNEAFGLDRIEEAQFPAEDAPTEQDIVANPDTINNIRLWDVEPLLATYNQIQSIRLYYDFVDVDVDRYVIDGKLRQVMLGGRELSQEKLGEAAQTWVNQRLQFTHGYGVAVSPVNEFSPEGLPNLWVQDVPPKGILDIKRPEIYYGEKTNNYVIVNTGVDEFDYPKEDTNVFTQYQADGGVQLSSFLRRVLYAWQMADPNIILTGDITTKSRILYYRNIQQRVSHIAPFILLDRDPYIVVSNGQLVWIQDGYTVTDQYPYSTPFANRFNYIRNSVKAVVSAYDGSVSLYVAEPNDPIIRTYMNIFPGLFKPFEEMPQDLRRHIRYPEDLFNVQATMYQTYHMKDPRVFYNKEDTWERPKEVYLQKEQAMNAYYVIMRLPGHTKPEFILMLPFTPVSKNNTIGWLAGRSDGENYGKLLAFAFPKEKLIFGPRQVESRIDQDPRISEQFALWNQSGSRVLRGNMLMIPIEKSFVYIEPIYLQSQQSQLPELKRVVFISGNRIAMDEGLVKSISRIYTGALAEKPPEQPPRPPQAQPPTDGQPVSTSVLALINEMREHFKKAQDRLKAGDWAGYGAEIKALEEKLFKTTEASSPGQGGQQGGAQ